MNRRIRKKKDKKITEAINGLVSIAEWQEKQRQAAIRQFVKRWPRGRTLRSAGTYDRGSLKTDRRFLCPFTGQAAFAAERSFMEFFNSAIGVLQTLVIALGAGLGIWGVINLLEGYGNDNPGAKSQGIKQLMAGGGVALIGTILVPLLSGLFG